MRIGAYSKGYAYLMSLSEYCQRTGGAVNRFGDIVSEADGKLLCDSRLTDVFERARVMGTEAPDGGGYLCYIHEVRSNQAVVQLADEDCRLRGERYNVPLDALYDDGINVP